MNSALRHRRYAVFHAKSTGLNWHTVGQRRTCQDFERASAPAPIDTFGTRPAIGGRLLDIDPASKPTHQRLMRLHLNQTASLGVQYSSGDNGITSRNRDHDEVPSPSREHIIHVNSQLAVCVE